MEPESLDERIARLEIEYLAANKEFVAAAYATESGSGRRLSDARRVRQELSLKLYRAYADRHDRLGAQVLYLAFVAALGEHHCEDSDAALEIREWLSDYKGSYESELKAETISTVTEVLRWLEGDQQHLPKDIFQTLGRLLDEH